MRPEEGDAAHLWDMLKAARDGLSFAKGLSLDQFMANELVRLATERELEIIGEAGRRISETFRKQHPEIPWKDIVGLRNVISHQYDKIDYPRIYDAVTRELPALIQKLTPFTPPPPKPVE